tara:strand:+ start:69 stop:713 length:645 start_codon:yes stop_codon:yes gene_type:complete
MFTAHVAKNFVVVPGSSKTKATSSRRSGTMRIDAFWKKEAPTTPPSPQKESSSGGLFGKRQRKSSQQQQPQTPVAYEETKTEAYARIRKQRAMRKAEFEAREKGGLSQALFKVTRALDFQEDIEADRGLLRDAKRMRKGESMSTEQYGALRRKVGGTKGGFFGESVDVTGKYRDSGWTKTNEDTTTSDQSFAPLLGVVLVGVIATLVLVAQQVP